MYKKFIVINTKRSYSFVNRFFWVVLLLVYIVTRIHNFDHYEYILCGLIASNLIYLTYLILVAICSKFFISSKLLVG